MVSTLKLSTSQTVPVNMDTKKQSSAEADRLQNERVGKHSVTLSAANKYAAEGVASAMAMPSVSIDPGASNGFGIAAATYDGKSAAGLGYAKRLRNGSKLDLAVGGSQSGKTGAKVGWSTSW